MDIPSHIAIIMDGNRRWARSKGLPVYAGHKYVADKILEPLIERASQLGISYVTLWAFSTENWNRDPGEVKVIMQIFRRSLVKFGQRMHKKGIRIRIIGDLSRFSADIRKQVEDLIKLTEKNTRITVIFALNYGGRDEIVRAIKKVSEVSKAVKNNSGFSSDTSDTYDTFDTLRNLTVNEFSNFLDTSGIPDPELIIRTGGEMRLSGFLSWQSQYSELMFPQWFMPEFIPIKLDSLLEEFNQRQRRFGK